MVFNDIQVIAHRGASYYAPENTMAAFTKAEALGARAIEFDVMLSQDGEAFVFHDETLGRTTNGQGRFDEASSEYIRSLDAGSWFNRDFSNEKILSFKEALLWFSTREIQANIEIKPLSEKTRETTVAVLQDLNRYWPTDKAYPLFSSFDYGALELCRQLIPELPLALLLDEWADDILKRIEELSCVSAHLSKKLVNRQRIEALKQADVRVCVFTVNRKRNTERLLSLGVDGVFSDDPLVLKQKWYQFFLKKPG